MDGYVDASELESDSLEGWEGRLYGKWPGARGWLSFYQLRTEPSTPVSANRPAKIKGLVPAV